MNNQEEQDNMTNDEKKKLRAKRFRKILRTWPPVIKNILSSLVDVVGDWAFYFRVASSDYATDLAPWLMAFSIIATILGCLTFTSLIMHHWKVCTNMHNVHKTRFETVVNMLLASEMFIEDIPQFILTYLVIARRSDGLSGVAVFNVTTSAFNFVFNTLDILVPLGEEHYDEISDGEKDEEAEEDYNENPATTGIE